MAAPKPDMTAARELALWTTNDGQLYRQQTQPIIKNLAKKKRLRIYDEAQALKAWFNLAGSGAQSYTKRFGDPKPNPFAKSSSYGIFDVPTRWETAKIIAQHYAEQLDEAAA